MFAMLDASAFAWSKRAFFNPADSNRPTEDTESLYGEIDGMYHWCRTLSKYCRCTRRL